MKNNLFNLLSQLMFGKISPGDFFRLREAVKKSNNDELNAAMSSLWEDDRLLLPMPNHTKMRVLGRLDCMTTTPISRSPWQKLLRVAAILFIPLLSVVASYYYIKQQTTPYASSEMLVMTNKGQKAAMVLPDGTKVWLNAHSTLSYPSDFGQRDRTVRLVGEGYFEVTTDHKNRFKVELDNIDVVVHGTKFNIASHADDHMTRISLLEGSVAVENKEEALLSRLSPHHTMEVNRADLQFEVFRDDTELTALWSQNKCRVENATAEEVFKRMAYWYGLKIEVEQINKEYRYGFTIKDESFREFLALINELTPLEYHIDGEEVVVRYI